MATRIYMVRDTNTLAPAKLVRAVNQAQALRHVVRDQFAVAVADQEDLVRLLSQGISVESAVEPEPEDEVGA